MPRRLRIIRSKGQPAKMEMTQTPYDPPVAQATPVMGGAGPPAQAFPAGTLHKEGCGPLRCIHVTVLVFGVINTILAFFSIFSANWGGLAIGLIMGSLGIAGGSMMNACGCCTDPVYGTCDACSGDSGCSCGTKCVAIVHVVNIVVHIVCIILLIVLMVQIGDICNVTGDSRCGGLGQAFVAILGTFCGWYVISLIVCAVALFFALKVTANQPGFSNI